MTTTAWIFVALTLAVAILDWAAVYSANAKAEYLLKPLTMVMLAGVVLTLDLGEGADRWWHLAAVLLSMVGDIFLMLPGDRDEYFLGGLFSFLLAHIAYIVGMSELGISSPAVLVGVALAVAAVGGIGSKIAPAAKRKDKRLFVPVIAYMCVIGTMLASSIGTGVPIGIVGAVLFCLSDSAIGWSRFVNEFAHHRMVIITTYHLGQLGLVLALLGS